MSTQVEINGITFLPIKDAAKTFSYSRDYIARLAREQKIVATQVGRQWFVDAVSLKNFAEASELELSVRKQQLSEERKREQVIKKEITAVREQTRSRLRGARREAQLVASLVLVLGLFTGAGIYTASSLFPLGFSSTANVGMVSTIVEPEPVVVSEEATLLIAEPQPTTLYSSEIEHPLFVEEAEVRSLSEADAAGIFLMAEDGEVKTVEEVEALFSDEVSVEFVDGSTGVVRYMSESGEVSEYQFVSVPVQKATARVPREVI